VVESRDDYHTLVVTDAFMALGFDEKKAVCGIVFMYYFPDPNQRDQYIELTDYRSGKSLGDLCARFGAVALTIIRRDQNQCQWTKRLAA